MPVEHQAQPQLGNPSVASVNAVLRQLRRSENSLYNCLNSILADAAFVGELAALYPGLQLVANLRCGLWYAPRARHTCYFKSTDGHNGNWAFSLTRLNLHVAELAAATGGCILVDATRRGKTFPDAFNKTVPIWCAVLNRALAAVRSQQPPGQLPPTVPAPPDTASSPSSASGDSAGAGVSCAAACRLAACDSGSQGVAPEAEGPCAAAQAAADQAAGPSTDAQPGTAQPGAAQQGGWDSEVHLPLWVSPVEANNVAQRLDAWVAQLLQVGPDLRPLAAALRKPLRPLWVHQGSRIWLNHLPDAAALPFTPVLLLSASLPNARQRRPVSLRLPRAPRAPRSDSEDDSVGAAVDESRDAGWAYEYVPGAGDDEESWARGLTPDLLWRHRDELVAAGPGGVEQAVQRLLQDDRGSQAEPQRAVARRPPHGGNPAAANGGLAHLPPRGCQPATAGLAPCGTGGLTWLGASGLAVGSFEAGQPPSVWTTVDAVLNCGPREHAGMRSQEAAGGGACASQPPHPEQPGNAAACTQAADGCGCSRSAPRYLWLAVPPAKEERLGLLRCLPAALAFLAAHLAAGRRVLIHDADGFDSCVAVAVAALLCSGQPPHSCLQQPLTLRLPVLAAAAPAPPPDDEQGGAGSDSCVAQPPGSGSSLAPAVSKEAVRQYLAVVSSCHPGARPTRSSLRQVFNVFQPPQRHGAAGASGEAA